MVPGMVSELAPRPLARLSWWRKRLTETRIHDPAVIQEDLVNGSILPSARRPSGSRAARKAGAYGASASSVLCRSDSTGHGLRARDIESKDSDFSGVYVGAVVLGLSFVPADNYAELDARRRSNSEREAQGHERAAAVVHPI